jgi:hypothetical protein
VLEGTLTLLIEGEEEALGRGELVRASHPLCTASSSTEVPIASPCSPSAARVRSAATARRSRRGRTSTACRRSSSRCPKTFRRASAPGSFLPLRRDDGHD